MRILRQAKTKQDQAWRRQDHTSRKATYKKAKKRDSLMSWCLFCCGCKMAHWYQALGQKCGFVYPIANPMLDLTSEEQIETMPMKPPTTGRVGWWEISAIMIIGDGEITKDMWRYEAEQSGKVIDMLLGQMLVGV